ncbi:MAG: hypothetical protein ABJ251_04705 [Paracoccaceae bacterium]
MAAAAGSGDGGARMGDSLFAESPDDITTVMLDGEEVAAMANTLGGSETATVSSAPASNVTNRNIIKSHLMRFDGVFEGYPANGLLSAEEIKKAFGTGLGRAPGSFDIPVAAEVGNQIEILVDNFGSLNPATGYMTVNDAQLETILAKGHIGLGLSALGGSRTEVLVVSQLSTEGATNADTTDPTTLKSWASQLDPKVVTETVQQIGATGLVGLVSGALGNSISEADLGGALTSFATNGYAGLSTWQKQTIGVAAYAFATHLSQPNAADPAAILQKAVRFDLGMEQSDHNIDKWQEYIFMGDPSDKTDGTSEMSEFVRSLFSTGRTVLAEYDVASAATLDTGTMVPGREKLIEFTGVDGVNILEYEDPLTVDGESFEADPLNFGDDTPAEPGLQPILDNGQPNPELFSTGSFLKVADENVVKDGAKITLKDGVFPPEQLLSLGIKHVMIRTKGGNDTAAMYQEVDYSDTATRDKLVSEGYTTLHLRADPGDPFSQTLSAVAPKLTSASQNFTHIYNADGSLKFADPTTRMARFYQQTGFEGKKLPKDDPDNIQPSEWDISVFNVGSSKTDKEAILDMLKDIGLTDQDIQGLLNKASAAGAQLANFDEKITPSDIGISIAQDILTGGLSELFKAFLPGTGHPFINYGIGKLKEQGRDTGQAHQVNDKYTGVNVKPEEIAEIVGFMILDLVDIVPVAALARGAAKGAKFAGKIGDAAATSRPLTKADEVPAGAVTLDPSTKPGTEEPTATGEGVRAEDDTRMYTEPADETVDTPRAGATPVEGQLSVSEEVAALQEKLPLAKYSTDFAMRTGDIQDYATAIETIKALIPNMVRIRGRNLLSSEELATLRASFADLETLKVIHVSKGNQPQRWRALIPEGQQESDFYATLYTTRHSDESTPSREFWAFAKGKEEWKIESLQAEEAFFTALQQDEELANQVGKLLDGQFLVDPKSGVGNELLQNVFTKMQSALGLDEALDFKSFLPEEMRDPSYLNKFDASADLEDTAELNIMSEFGEFYDPATINIEFIDFPRPTILGSLAGHADPFGNRILNLSSKRSYTASDLMKFLWHELTHAKQSVLAARHSTLTSFFAKADPSLSAEQVKGLVAESFERVGFDSDYGAVAQIVYDADYKFTSYSSSAQYLESWIENEAWSAQDSFNTRLQGNG